MTEQDKIVVLQDNHRLRAENDTLRRERDEAIRERDEARRAWDAASDPINQLLLDELWSRRIDASEANARIQQLLGVSEQLREALAVIAEFRDEPYSADFARDILDRREVP